ncbi:MAG: tRNA preQ1(34) S-adenosylmethionine ribosyltransferase-isomerase QueA [Pseudomonadota bacterium]
MKTADFTFDLPEDLIAQAPLAERSASRLLVVDRAAQQFSDRQFAELPELLAADDLLVFNDTRVIPARLFGRKESGGRVEIMVERVLDERRAIAQIRASKSPRPGTRIGIDGASAVITVGERVDGFFSIDSPEPLAPLLEQAGHMPLPPYIQRADAAADRERYQTLFAAIPGAVAAPTAGLHFDAGLLDRLDAMGVDRAYVTLHVGAGTFQPVRVDNVADHRMHAEWLEVGTETAAKHAACRGAGGRVVAVGTTSLRSLETCWADDAVVAGQHDTRLFIYPGRTVHSIDALLTNFHLPESTLLMLVCALGGTELMLAAYAHAVRDRYRFFSYGDAMLIL